MSEDTPKKRYPLTTKEVATMLGIKHTSEDLPLGTFASKTAAPAADLPVVEHQDHTADNHVSHLSDEPQEKHGHKNHPSQHEEHTKDGKNQPIFVKLGKAALPYVAIFTIGLFIYYFFFTTINFGSIFKPATSATPAQNALEALERQDASKYQAWIKGFYYDVSDDKILDPEADNSGNGLTNFQKYLLNLNPKSYDTLGNGLADSELIAMGINPLTGSALTDEQKEIINKYIDMEVVSNRLTLSRLKSGQNVAGASVSANTTTNAGISPRAETDFQNFGLGNRETGLDVNTEVAGQLSIPDLKITVPIIWSQSDKNFDKDLQKGVIHYPGTAVPGQIGTTYIAGHSSNYAWAKGEYNRVFANLGNLGNNASFSITLTKKDGQKTTLHYVVTSKKEFSASDPEQFRNGGQSVVALSTCWPVGSTAKRLVVFGQLTQIQ